jgi:hypothetical protein
VTGFVDPVAARASEQFMAEHARETKTTLSGDGADKSLAD